MHSINSQTQQIATTILTTYAEELAKI